MIPRARCQHSAHPDLVFNTFLHFHEPAVNRLCFAPGKRALRSLVTQNIKLMGIRLLHQLHLDLRFGLGSNDLTLQLIDIPKRVLPTDSHLLPHVPCSPAPPARTPDGLLVFLVLLALRYPDAALLGPRAP